jgi:TctA family transporter
MGFLAIIALTAEIMGPTRADAYAVSGVMAATVVPTLLLGIPGSSGMAILLLMLISIGVQPGPNLLDENLEILWFMVLLLVIASVVASVFCIATIRFMAKATQVPVASIIAPVLVVSFFGAYATKFTLGDIVVVFLAGTGGFLMVRYGYSRTTLVIGYVLGGLAEYNYLMARRIFGWTFLTRPIVVVLGVVLVVTILGPAVQSLIRMRRSRIERRIADAASEQAARLGS